jgi:nucleoid DNA-binding protein
MKKSEMIKALAKRLNVSQKEAKRHLEAFFSLTGESLACGNEVSLRGFGEFYVSEGNASQIGGKPKKRVRFKAGTELNSFAN